MSLSLRRLASLSTLALSLGIIGLSACEDGDEPGQSTTMGTGGHGTHSGHGDHGHGGPNATSCMGHPVFTPGISGMGATHKLTVINSEPVKPEVDFNNAWIVKLETKAGQPVDGATFKRFSPQMPHHGHGLPAEHLVTVTAQPASGPGVYRVSNLAFSMLGYWKTEVMVEGKNPDGTSWADKLFIETCIGT